MAKASMIARENKRMRTAEKYANKRNNLRAVLKDSNSAEEERCAAQVKLQKLPRDASPWRRQRRCRITGRPHGYIANLGSVETSYAKLRCAETYLV